MRRHAFAKPSNVVVSGEIVSGDMSKGAMLGWGLSAGAAIFLGPPLVSHFFGKKRKH